MNCYLGGLLLTECFTDIYLGLASVEQRTLYNALVDDGIEDSIRGMK